jgi:hypothetical protein
MRPASYREQAGCGTCQHVFRSMTDFGGTYCCFGEQVPPESWRLHREHFSMLPIREEGHERWETEERKLWNASLQWSSKNGVTETSICDEYTSAYRGDDKILEGGREL